MAVTLIGPAGVHELPEGESLLGRGDDCLVRVVDARLSRHHARLVVSGGQLTVHDLGSANGVLVNGDRIRVPTVVGNGAILVCGPLALRVACDGTPSAPAPAPRPEAGMGQQRTEAMDPKDIQRALAEAEARRAGRLDPAIAAAVADPKALTDIHPSDLLPVTSTSALSPNRFSPPPQLTPPARRSTGMLPQEAAASASGALEPADPLVRHRGRHRLLAGLLDGGGWLLLAMLPAAVCAVGGSLLAWLWAQAGVGPDGLPSVGHGVPPASPGALLPAVVRSIGDGSLLRDLYGTVPLSRFLVAILSWVLGAGLGASTMLFGLVLPTCRGDGPAWHARWGLVVVDASGRPPGCIRAMWRWLLLFATAPCAVLTAVLGIRGVHDILSGCRLRWASSG